MWHFRRMSRAEINEDPTASDFFSTEALQEITDALVRESIQNSLDARRPEAEQPVLVRIKLGRSNSSHIHRWFESLWPHVDECDDYLSDSPSRDDQLTWISIEDFETRGLLGDETASDDPPEGERNDFFYFWRNIGRGKKSGQDLGRWGLGKITFPAASRIHSFLGLTVRSNDEEWLLMGQSVLQIHHLQGQKYAPYGYFGRRDGDDDFVVPARDDETCSAFIDDFGLSRTCEPGLSLVIPFPQQEIKHSVLAKSAMRHYFYPILAGKLIIEIIDKENGTRLDSETIKDEVKNYFPRSDKSFFGLLSLAEEVLNRSDDDLIQAAPQDAGRIPEWTEDLLSGEQLEKIAETFDAGESVILNVPVWVLPKGGGRKESSFIIAIQRDAELDHAMDIFIRQGITITGVHSLRDSGVRALVLAEEPDIAAFLGDSENPAHTEWQSKSRKFKGKYRVGASTLQFVKDAPRGLMKLLNQRSEKIDDTALRDVFPASSPSGNRTPAGGVHEADPTRTREPIPPQQRSVRATSLNRNRDGFTLTLTDHGKSKTPFQIGVTCAYDVAKGNPFKKWQKSDFDLTGGDQVAVDGGGVTECYGNKLKVVATDNEFRLHVNGFDPNRDLIVDCREEDAGDA